MKNIISFSNPLTALAVVSGLSVALSLMSTALAAPPSTVRVSVSSTEEEANNLSYSSSISGNGRTVAFYSEASNLVPGDHNNIGDIFVRDLKTGITQRVSVNSAGTEANGSSAWPSVSATGRFVAFWSAASNLVPGTNNGMGDIFVRDLKTGAIQKVTVTSTGAEINGYSYFPSISANGRFVAFWSAASNLVAGDNNSIDDIFVRDLKTGITQRVSVDSAGAESNGFSAWPSISANGRFVTFGSEASNLVAGDNNGTYDVFVHDLKTGATERMSVDSAGAEANNESTYSSVSATGRFVAFWSYASNLVAGDNNGAYDIFVRDLKTGVTQRVSVSSTGEEGNSSSSIPSISANGRFVAFSSVASNLVAGDNNGTDDVFVRDLNTGVTERVSVDSAGTEGNNRSYGVTISANGRTVAFESYASNLVPEDNNAVEDIFVRRRR